MNDLPMDMLHEDMEAASIGASKRKAPEGASLLVNVFPSLSKSYVGHKLMGKSRFFGDIFYAPRVGSDFSHKIFGQDGVSVRFTACLSGLLYFVINVVLRGSKLKVFRVNAAWVVACVHNNKSLRDFGFVVKLIREPMRGMGLFAFAKLTITPAITTSLPFKAVAAFNSFVFCVKAFFQCAAVSMPKSNIWVAVALKSDVVLDAKAKRFDWLGTADGASAHIQPPIVEARVMKVLGSLHGNRFSAAKPSQAGAF